MIVTPVPHSEPTIPFEIEVLLPQSAFHLFANDGNAEKVITSKVFRLRRRPTVSGTMEKFSHYAHKTVECLQGCIVSAMTVDEEGL